MNKKIDEQINKIIGKIENKKPIIDTLVLCGGGVKFITHVGVLKALNEMNIYENITTFAGTSSGGIVSLMCCIGYTSQEMETIAYELDLSKTYNFDFNKFMKLYGSDDGRKFEIVIEGFLQGKNLNPKITFKELFEITKKELILTSTCLNTRSLKWLSYKTTPNLEIVKAIRMTTCIPLIFEPVIYENHIYIDGGCMNNYPIDYFKDTIETTLGIYVADNNNFDDYDDYETINNFVKYLSSILTCYQKTNFKKAIEGYENRTIIIKTLDINSIAFNISKDKKTEMIKLGYKKTIDFIDKHNMRINKIN